MSNMILISTHSPRAGRTARAGIDSVCNIAFQLTRPMRGEPNCNIRDLKLRSISTHSPHAGRTACFAPSTSSRWDFNSLAPCGANLDVANLGSITVNISTHSPHAGRTTAETSFYFLRQDFNSLAPCGANLSSTITLPRRSPNRKISTHSPRDLDSTFARVKSSYISTHSPHAGRTFLQDNSAAKTAHFNSLAPCGANPIASLTFSNCALFQLTRPMRGEPPSIVIDCTSVKISTHSPHAGRTTLSRVFLIIIDLFQLTRPMRGEPCVCLLPFNVC